MVSSVKAVGQRPVADMEGKGSDDSQRFKQLYNSSAVPRRFTFLSNGSVLVIYHSEYFQKKQSYLPSLHELILWHAAVSNLKADLHHFKDCPQLCVHA